MKRLDFRLWWYGYWGRIGWGAGSLVQQLNDMTYQIGFSEGSLREKTWGAVIFWGT
ncbi:MAG: hypothetical protein M1470_14890 [Bacteroidetes bacterium]|nr:hypothetical protein [Bacteroidota bacterium]MCL5737076.1 hypothetical protein [Bacteroidota bacterium]